MKVGCPPASEADRRESVATVPRPAGDVTDETGKRFVSLGGLQKAIDDRDAAIARKNRVIDRLARHVDGCRDGSPAPSHAPSPLSDASGSKPDPPPAPDGRRPRTMLAGGAQ